VRNPRVLARIAPAKLGFWSFLSALAHGAGLMLLPLYLGLCGTEGFVSVGHSAAGSLIGRILVSFFQVVMVLTIQRLRQSLFSNIKLSVRKAAKVCWD